MELKKEACNLGLHMRTLNEVSDSPLRNTHCFWILNAMFVHIFRSLLGIIYLELPSVSFWKDINFESEFKVLGLPPIKTFEIYIKRKF